MKVETVAKALGSAVDEVRDAAFEEVASFLREREDWTEIEAMKLWKGLFYAMWNLDGESRQVDRAASIAACLLDEAISEEIRLSFWKAFLATMRKEWIYIDQYRLDKYYALARQMLHAVFLLSLRKNWRATSCVDYFFSLEEEILSAKGIAAGLPGHFAEIYGEELDKALQEEEELEVSQRGFVCLLFPFKKALHSSPPLRAALKKKIQSNSPSLSQHDSIHMCRCSVVDALKQQALDRKQEERFQAAVELLGLEQVAGSAEVPVELEESAINARDKLQGPQADLPPPQQTPKRTGDRKQASRKKKRRRSKKQET